MKQVLIFSCLCFLLSFSLPAQKIHGTWHNPQFAYTLTLMPDGSFLTRSNGTFASGSFFRLGNLITTQINGGTFQYQINQLSADEMILMDAQGNTLPLKRRLPGLRLPTADRFPEVLAREKSFEIREADVRMGVATIEFLTNKSLEATKVERLRQSAIEDFKRDPKEFYEGMAFLNELMEQIALYSDPIAVALIRSRVYATLYQANQALPPDDRSELINITVEELPVAAFDVNNKVVLSERDLIAALDYLDQMNKMQGEASLSREKRQEIGHLIRQQFSSLSPEDQQFYANASMFLELIQHNIQQFSPQQYQQIGQQWQSSPQAQPLPSWGQQTNSQIDPETYRFLSRLSLQNHVSMLNGIEAMGGSSDYWEIKPSYLGNW